MTGEELKLHHLKATGPSNSSLSIAIALGKAVNIVMVDTIAIVKMDIQGFEGGYDHDDHGFHHQL